MEGTEPHRGESAEREALEGALAEIDVARGLHTFKTEDLIQDDIDVWHQLQAGTLSREDLMRWEGAVLGSNRTMSGKGSSREDFVAFMRSQATPYFLDQDFRKKSRKTPCS